MSGENDETEESEVNRRWRENVPHDSRSFGLATALADIDNENNDRFKIYANGERASVEELAYLLDIYFSEEDREFDVAPRVCESDENQVPYPGNDLVARHGRPAILRALEVGQFFFDPTPGNRVLWSSAANGLRPMKFRTRRESGCCRVLRIS